MSAAPSEVPTKTQYLPVASALQLKTTKDEPSAVPGDGLNICATPERTASGVGVGLELGIGLGLGLGVGLGVGLAVGVGEGLGEGAPGNTILSIHDNLSEMRTA